MRPINDVYVAELGPADVEIAIADSKTAFAVQEVLAGRWAKALADRTTREHGQAGARGWTAS
ncbi:DUF6207 family protein [Streptomyces sp. NPDC057623]|uniref:DUF6207 family protein n=1 Tax=Streptomyces sp. NPDC057623 TaxID=3346187 RepID=UPI003684832B